MNKNIALNIGNYGIFTTENIKRSIKPKQEYFKLHNIKKRSDFELHHIIAISKARNKKEVQILDNVENLIYLQKTKHMEFTKKQNKNVYLNINSHEARFCDFDKDIIITTNDKDSLYSKDCDILKKIDCHNKKVIKQIYQFDRYLECI